MTNIVVEVIQYLHRPNHSFKGIAFACDRCWAAQAIEVLRTPEQKPDPLHNIVLVERIGRNRSGYGKETRSSVRQYSATSKRMGSHGRTQE